MPAWPPPPCPPRRAGRGVSSSCGCSQDDQDRGHHGEKHADDDNSEEEGPSYFGFVRDTNGATVPDAKVTVGVKNRGGIVTRTDLLGTYKVPGFGKEVDPKDVEVSCDKPGYKQLRVVRRSSPSTDPKIPVETECTLQRI